MLMVIINRDLPALLLTCYSGATLITFLFTYLNMQLLPTTHTPFAHPTYLHKCYLHDLDYHPLPIISEFPKFRKGFL